MLLGPYLHTTNCFVFVLCILREKNIKLHMFVVLLSEIGTHKNK